MGWAEAIRRLNDRFRQSLEGGRALVTRGVLARGEAFTSQAVAAVKAFDAFTPDNDPHEEHDFGAIEIDGTRLFFKIDYYDLSERAGSPDPTDPNVTVRVLTIMLAEEY
ncbi:conserved hypothetical protein [uncultured Defluviicoccus sp.]|mgnify:FL=1|uniref:DUF3768 domain-containing protein n=1 Tax=metagenome TaxID=256318 RepID=A0A380TJA2_9ZZZZ|nr:conserved hypothetical protein [uncultured Defluviicoccus sp.]